VWSLWQAQDSLRRGTYDAPFRGVPAERGCSEQGPARLVGSGDQQPRAGRNGDGEVSDQHTAIAPRAQCHVVVDQALWPFAVHAQQTGRGVRLFQRFGQPSETSQHRSVGGKLLDLGHDQRERAEQVREGHGRLRDDPEFDLALNEERADDHGRQ
jgi:hypothetical protein